MIAHLFRSYIILPRVERKCLRQAFYMLLKVHMALKLRGYKLTRAYVEKLSMPEMRHCHCPPHLVVLNVRRAARLIPGAYCLSLSLAAYVFLKRAGYDTVLRIGVRNGQERFAAHAWIEVDGNPVLEPAVRDIYHFFDADGCNNQAASQNGR